MELFCLVGVSSKYRCCSQQTRFWHLSLQNLVSKATTFHYSLKHTLFQALFKVKDLLVVTARLLTRFLSCTLEWIASGRSIERGVWSVARNPEFYFGLNGLQVADLLKEVYGVSLATQSSTLVDVLSVIIIHQLRSKFHCLANCCWEDIVVRLIYVH